MMEKLTVSSQALLSSFLDEIDMYAYNVYMCVCLYKAACVRVCAKVLAHIYANVNLCADDLVVIEI